MSHHKYDLAIIGAGPAGMMAAIRAAECGASVIVLDKMPNPGIKLLMTGKERCNITNNEHDPKVFADYFGRGGKFLLTSLYHFGVSQTIDFFETNGLPTKVERGERVFPVSDQAKDVQLLLVRLMKKHGVTLKTNVRITDFYVDENRIKKIILTDAEIDAKNILIATGGLSYPKSGSTGDGYAWAKKFGHTVVEPRPSLTPILVKEEYVKELEGLSLKNVSVIVQQNDTKQAERFGEALFMGNGLSGPIILDVSKKVGKLLKNGEVKILIDFKPALEWQKLDARLIRDFEEFNTKKVQNALSALLPKRMIPIILKLAEIDPDKQCNTVSKKERKRLRILLKEFPFTVDRLVGFKKAVITAGGVSLREIDAKTMRSKIMDNLYFAGEILDLDGPTGGYNLQVCWSTGYLAGESAAQ